MPIQTMKCVKNNEPNTQSTCTAITFWILFKMCRKCAFMPLCVQVIYGIKIHTTNSLSKSSQANSKSKCYFDYISNDSTTSWWRGYQSECLLVNFVRILLSFETIFTISGEMLIAPLYEQKTCGNYQNCSLSLSVNGKQFCLDEKSADHTGVPNSARARQMQWRCAMWHRFQSDA